MKIVFLETIGMELHIIEKACQSLLRPEDKLVIYKDRIEDEEVLIQRAEGAEVVVVSNIPLSNRFFQSLPTLRLLSVAFAGVDHIDMEAARRCNVTVMNAAGYSTHAVAELTIGMMISLLRRMTILDGEIRNGKDRAGFLGGELRGRCVGVVGMGAIGQEVARLALAFGCRVMAYNRSPQAMEGVEFCSMERLCCESDLITLHVPLTKETTDLISEKEFSMMKPQALLINTARGGVVNSMALYNALKCRTIAGAALDVYVQEPPLPKECELFDLEQVLLLPHVGYATEEAFVNRLNRMVENIAEYRKLNG